MIEIDELDRRVDDWWERWRGHPVLDRVFFTATNAGEFSALWHAVGAAKAVRGSWTWRDAARFSVAMGLESLVVNQGVKRLFGRGRPATAAENDSDHRLRQPLTSSFPSGHASAAFCAATLLASNQPSRWGLRAIAAIVAASRVHVRLHHASDVAGGAAVGLVVGAVLRPVLRAGASVRPANSLGP